MRRQRANWYTFEHQIQLAHEALDEATNHLKADWFASSIVHSFQVAHRVAAAHLFGHGARIFTEKEVLQGLQRDLIQPGHAPDRLLTAYQALETQRDRAEHDYDYAATRQEAQDALEKAIAFWTWSQKARPWQPKPASSH